MQVRLLLYPPISGAYWFRLMPYADSCMPWSCSLATLIIELNITATNTRRNNGLEALGLPVIAYGPRVAVAEESFAA